MQLGLEGKVALVTGGSDGIGRAIVAGLAAEGAHVALCARNVERLDAAAGEIAARHPGSRILAVPADVAVRADLERLHAAVVAEFGPVDILVNNAGAVMRMRVEQSTDEDWAEDVDVKLMSAVRLSRLVTPGMRAGGGGRIINITAIAGKHPEAGSAPTAVSRAAGMALTKVLSRELAEAGILVNTVCIGVVRSGQHERRRQARSVDLDPDEFYERLAQDRSIPLGRVGTGEEAANLVVFLASAAASYVTGAAINLDGGLSHVL